MKSTAPRAAMPREVEALRASLNTRLTALEKALADPKQHGSLEALILDLARIATEEADATARQAVLDAQMAGQSAAAAARAEAVAALEAEKVESAALLQVIEQAKTALAQAEVALKDERRAAEQRLTAARAEMESERAALAREIETGRAVLAAEQQAATQLLERSSELEQELAKVRGELEAVHTELGTSRRELDEVRAERDATRGGLEAAQRELEGVRRDSDARTETLSHSQAEHEEALRTAHDLARTAQTQLEQAIAERDSAQTAIAELRAQLETAQAAARDVEELRRELQAAQQAHEARDAAEALHASKSPGPVSSDDEDPETLIDLASLAAEEERREAIERRTRALELALRDAEMRAESAELELDGYRRPGAPAPRAAVQHSAAQPPAGGEQFRGPARGAKRVSFRTEIDIQVDGTPGKLVDLSVTGAQVVTATAMKPGRLAKITLPVGEDSIPCAAKIAWSRLEPREGQLLYRAGVAFTSVDQLALEGFLADHEK